MKVSVIVPCYNRNDILLLNIRGLINQDLTDNLYEVVIVDDCSLENPYQAIEKDIEGRQNFRYIRHDVNKGLAAARNTGIAHATGDIVLCLDSDIVPEKAFVRSHLELYEKYRDEFIAVVSNLRYADDYIRGSNFGRFMNDRYLGNRAPSERKLLDFNNLPPQYFGGGISSVKRKRIQELGMFDSSFVRYGGEDEDMGYRLSKAGARIIFCESARALHHDTVTLDRYKLKAREWKLGAFPIIIVKQPEYFQSTNLRYLLPLSLTNDKVPVILKKLLCRIFLNRITVFLLEKWTKLTDGINFLYMPFTYRALMAGWFIVNKSTVSASENEIGVWK
jgi:GT2 family glycosyltransferase